MLVAAGAGVVNAVSHGQVGRAAAVTAPGIMVLALIYTIGETSGAHLNPAVTVAFAARGHFPWRRVPGYLLAQVTGAVLAAALLRSLFGDAGGLGRDGPGTGDRGRDRPGDGDRADLRPGDRDPRDRVRCPQCGP